MNLLDWYKEEVIKVAKEEILQLNEQIKLNEKKMMQRLIAVEEVETKQQWHELLQEMGITEFQYKTMKNAYGKGVL